MDKPAVLLIDDSDTWARIIRQGLGPNFDMVAAPSFAVAEERLRDHRGFRAIVIGMADDSTFVFVQKIAPGFRGPLIAATVNPKGNNFLKAVGCSHAARDKHHAVHLIRSICNGSAHVPAGSQ